MIASMKKPVSLSKAIQAAQERRGGIECPQCGCRHFFKTRTTDTRVADEVRRYKTCRHCGHKIVTYERTARGHREA